MLTIKHPAYFSPKTLARLVLYAVLVAQTLVSLTPRSSFLETLNVLASALCQKHCSYYIEPLMDLQRRESKAFFQFSLTRCSPAIEGSYLKHGRLIAQVLLQLAFNFLARSLNRRRLYQGFRRVLEVARST